MFALLVALIITAPHSAGALSPGLPRTCANLHHKVCLHSHLTPATIVPIPLPPPAK